jgi:small subunit ribosomal protein S15
MLVTTEAKKEIFKAHGNTETNTGHAEGQIALFSALINLVGKRRSLLDYLHKTDIMRYRAIVAKLGLRK